MNNTNYYEKLFLLTIAACMAVAVSAQELPYSKYLNFDKKDFRENHFKYNDKTNTWSVSKVNGWMTAFLSSSTRMIRSLL